METPVNQDVKTRILIAEDDVVSCRLLEATLVRNRFEVVVARDGAAALARMMEPNAPKIAILDWMMPEISGIEVCQKIREVDSPYPPYLMMLTARGSSTDIVSGLNSGANDYITKPFDSAELLARVRVGVRVVELQTHLAARVRELEAALSKVKQLQGLLPICSYCKKIRNDKNYWQQVETYVGEHSGARFSHGICPECFEKEIKPQLQNLEQASESLWESESDSTKGKQT